MLDPLKQLVRIQKQRSQLKHDYDHYLKKALETGYTTSQIARELCVSEAAIRMYRKRNKL